MVMWDFFPLEVFMFKVSEKKKCHNLTKRNSYDAILTTKLFMSTQKKFHLQFRKWLQEKKVNNLYNQMKFLKRRTEIMMPFFAKKKIIGFQSK